MKGASSVLVFLIGVPGLLLFAAAVSAQPSACAGVDAVHERCLASCFSLDDHAQVVPCLMRCDNAAATSPSDDEVTLSSEEYVERWGGGAITTAGACHSTAPCPPEYGSCASWSGYSACGSTFCGVYRFCCESGPAASPGSPSPGLPNCDILFGDALLQNRERFRVCFNAAGQSCTEYQRTSVVLGCGCF